MSHKRLITIGILVFLLESGLIALWFYRTEPAMLAAMDIFKVIPVLVVINLFAGFLIRMINKPLGFLIILNAVLCPIIFYASWIMWFTSGLRPYNSSNPDYISKFDRDEMMTAFKSEEFRRIIDLELSYTWKTSG